VILDYLRFLRVFLGERGAEGVRKEGGNSRATKKGDTLATDFADCTDFGTARRYISADYADFRRFLGDRI
jgi:hypothetical protein